MTVTRDAVARALAPLVGLAVWGPARESNMLALQLGERRPAPTRADPRRELGAYALHVFCAWRLLRGDRIVAGSGDLFTPADPDDDLETFDFDVPGSTWWDVRLADHFATALPADGAAAPPAPPTVTAVAADTLGGARLTLSDGAVLEILPNSSPAEHFETEFWRLRGGDGADVVVGTFGVDREHQE